MDIEAGFLADIVASTGDDAPRLIFADYLEERGQPGDTERAGMIRHKFPVASGRRREVQRWERYTRALLGSVVKKSWMVWLLATPGSHDWARELPGKETWAGRCIPTTFQCSKKPFVVCLRHGFVVGFCASWKIFKEKAAQLFRTQPIEFAAVNSFWAEPEEDYHFVTGDSSSHVGYSNLPAEIFDLMQAPKGHLRGRGATEARGYRTRQACYNDIGQACLLYGRQQAQLWR